MTNSDVFAAILAMDAYHRGYAPGLNKINQSTQLGLATIKADSSILTDSLGNRLDINSGFYAVAYQWTDLLGTKHTAISYRGTNPDTTSPEGFRASPLVRDIWNGWRIAGGYADASQAQLALRFAESVFDNKSEV
jgi:hypothetical protein